MRAEGEIEGSPYQSGAGLGARRTKDLHFSPFQVYSICSWTLHWPFVFIFFSFPIIEHARIFANTSCELNCQTVAFPSSARRVNEMLLKIFKGALNALYSWEVSCNMGGL